MSWLRLDLCRRLIFPARLLFRNGFRSPLEVLFTELEFRHAVLTIHAAPLGFEHYVRSESPILSSKSFAKSV